MITALLFMAFAALLLLNWSGFAEEHVDGDSYTAGEALAIYRRVRLSGSTSRTVVYADAGEEALGITQQAADSGDQVRITFLEPGRTMKCTASEAIAACNGLIYGADDGEIADTANGPPIGRNLDTASAAGSIIECRFAQIATLDVFQGVILDCQTGEDTADHLLIPAAANPGGIIIKSIFGRVTEAFVGSSEDQGIVTVYDQANNALATLTPSNAGADAIGDLITGYHLLAGTTGDALKVVAAGAFVDCKVTQNTAGGSPAGKMAVYIEYIPILG